MFSKIRVHNSRKNTPRFDDNHKCRGDFYLRTSCKKILLTVLLIYPAVFIMPVSCSKEHQTVIIKGSTTVEPIIKKAAERYSEKKGAKIIVESNGSHSGITALIERKCDIVDSSVKISQEEIKKADERGIKIKEFIIAYDLIIPVVHPSNPISNLTMSQLSDIFSCRETNWKKFGWSDRDILLAVRDNSSGTHDVWNEIHMCRNADMKNASVESSNSGVIAYVSKEPGAIGYISYGYLNSEVKALSINGIKPAAYPQQAEKFPIRRKLYLYVDDNRFSQTAKSFIIYLLSREGQELIREAGFIPVTMAYME